MYFECQSSILYFIILAWYQQKRRFDSTAMPPRARPTRLPARNTATERIRAPVKTSHSPSELIDAISSPQKLKPEVVRLMKEILENGPSIEESRKLAMKIVNAALNVVASLHKAGWTSTQPVNSYTQQNVTTISSLTCVALDVLRKNATSTSAGETARAAVSFSSRLLNMKMVNFGFYKLLVPYFATLSSLP